MNDVLLDALRQQTGGDAAAGTDPVLGLLSQMIAQREQTLTRDLEAREQEEGRREAEARVAQEARRLEELRELEEERQAARRARLERLRFRLEALDRALADCQARLDGLALALGACPNCWGEDPECRLCRGRGGPGFLRPEAAAFRRLVLPALEAASPHPEPRAFAGEDKPAPERTPL